MIVLHSISQVVGRAQFRKTVLENVTWQIPPRTKAVILGQPHSGAAALLNILGGMTVPTSGWVERRAKVSVPGGLLRYAMRDTTRQLILRLSQIYHVNPSTVDKFVIKGLENPGVLDVPPNSLPQYLRQQLSVVLTYAFPCDFYLFNNTPVAIGEPRVQAFCERALELRSRQAGIIVRTASGKAARKLNPAMMGAVVHGGNLTLYERLTDAIAVFENLPPEGDTNILDDRPEEITPPLETEEAIF